MKRVFIITILIVGLVATYSFAHMQEGMMGSDTMMGSQSQLQTGEIPQTGWYSPCPHMMGQGGYRMMGPGMMGQGGYGMMGPGMMGQGGYGMMGPGMMGQGGYGMTGQGMMGYGIDPGMMWEYKAKTYKKFLNDTADLRKELHNKKFEYFEILRNPKTKPETITKFEKEIQELQRKIYKKLQR
jgi:hypothetical protein